MKEISGTKYYLYETHCHTLPVSACAKWSPEELVDCYIQKGYDGVMITDHFFNGNCGIDRSLPWKEKVEQFCKGYERAKAHGDRSGFAVFFGFEYNRRGAEFLIYGVDKLWLMRHEDIMEMSIPQLYALVAESGGVMIQAHPFRRASYLENICLYPDYCDGVEAINTANYLDEYNENAIWYANRFSLFMTCGSDAHFSGRYNLGGVYLPQRLDSIAEYVHIIKSKEHIGLYTENGKRYDLKKI